MKYILLFILITLYSCGGEDFKCSNPQSSTTIELQNLAAQDTITYKIIQIPNSTKYYCINTDTNLVEYKMTNYSGAADTLALILIIMIFIIFIIMLIASTNGY